jgi:hypothetical protein
MTDGLTRIELGSARMSQLDLFLQPGVKEIHCIISVNDGFIETDAIVMVNLLAESPVYSLLPGQLQVRIYSITIINYQKN